MLIIFVVGLVLILGYIFFGGKKVKKKAKKEESKESKIEPVIKSNRENPEEVQEEKKIEVKEPNENHGFKIIKKQSKVNINKQALKNGSRNPSVTKVFDRNKKTEEKIEIQPIEDFKEEYKPEKKVERFGAREIDYSIINKGVEFSINNQKGDLNRAPIITDRTNFNSHLNVSEDGNISGVIGTGIGKSIQMAEQIEKKVDDDTDKMIANIKRNFLSIEDDINPFDRTGRRVSEEKQKNKSTLSQLDAKTLILADMINNPKYKENRKKD